MGILIDTDTFKEFTEKLISRLKERSKEYNSGVRLHGKPEEMLTYEAIEIVNQVAEEFATDTNVGNKDGWIPVSSGKLPEVEGNYLVTRKSGKVNIGMFVFFANGGFFNPYDDLIRFPDKKVIAWKSLSEPYRPSEELGEPKPCVNTACAYHKENADCEAAEGCAGYEPPAEPDWKGHMMNRFMRGE